MCVCVCSAACLSSWPESSFRTPIQHRASLTGGPLRLWCDARTDEGIKKKKKGENWGSEICRLCSAHPMAGPFASFKIQPALTSLNSTASLATDLLYPSLWSSLECCI